MNQNTYWNCLHLSCTEQWKTLGNRAFKVVAPKLWNSLPKDVSSCNNVNVSKTHYFKGTSNRKKMLKYLFNS